MKKGDYQIPFDSNGDMLTYAGHGMMHGTTVTWKDNFQWDDNLEYESYGKGMSAIHIYFRSLVSGKKYTMFMTDFHDIIKDMVTGRLSGTFTFQKRGMNFGVRRI